MVLKFFSQLRMQSCKAAYFVLLQLCAVCRHPYLGGTAKFAIRIGAVRYKTVPFNTPTVVKVLRIGIGAVR